MDGEDLLERARDQVSQLELAAERIAPEVRERVESKFGFTVANFGMLLPNYSEYASLDLLVSYLASQYDEGLIETNEDAIASLEIFITRLSAIRSADHYAYQLARHVKAGVALTAKNAGYFNLKALGETVQKLMKVSIEQRDAQAMTRRARKELGLQSRHGLGGLMDKVMQRDVISTSEDMVSFLRERISHRSVDGGASADETGMDRKLSRADMEFLLGSAPA